MRLLYNLGNNIYWLLVILISPFNQKAKLFVEGRKGWQVKLRKDFAQNISPVAWFHCASLGEFEQGRPVIEAFRQEFPDFKIMLTFFSPSGYEVRKNYAQADWIYYLPIDTASNAKYFVETINPNIALFVKYEFWHHYISELSQRSIPVISFSTIFRESQPFFKSWGGFNRQILRKITRFFVQTAQSEQLLRSIGIENSNKVGDTRFDRVFQICSQRKEVDLAKRFRSNTATFVLGSIWKADLEVIGGVLDNFPHPLKVIIAPHEIAPSDVSIAKSYFKKRKVAVFSETDEESVLQADVLIIDNMGMLSALYSYADFAFIGGAFGKGLHNTLEAATFGVPIFFGNKKHQKFQEAQDMLGLGSAFAISSATEFASVFTELYENPTKRKEVGDRNANYVKENLGATDKIIGFCSLVLRKNGTDL